MKTPTKILLGSLTALFTGAILIDCHIYMTGATLMSAGLLGTFTFSMLADLLDHP